MTECKICFEEFKALDVETICEDCQRKILENLKVRVDKAFNVSKDKEALSNFVYLVSELGGLVDYLLHALENHTHGTKVVDTVDIQQEVNKINHKIVVSGIDEESGIIWLDRVISDDCPISNVITSLRSLGKYQRINYLRNYGLSQFIWNMINWMGGKLNKKF